MKVLVACEISGRVRRAFAKMGHDAWSCDISDEGEQLDIFNAGNENMDLNKHLTCDVLEILYNGWDIIIAHPPCTDLCSTGRAWFKEKRADGRQQKSIEFFMRFTELKCKWCIENPIGIMSNVYRKPDQIIQPWQFGHGETKATCLWLNGLPPLVSTNIVNGRKNRINNLPPSSDRARIRSTTYQGIAEAMAQQWGNQ